MRCFPLPAVRQEVVDPADEVAIAWLCQLLRTGRADLYVEDEADLSLLPTLTRTWMRVSEQLQVRAPGTNEKRSVAAATDVGDGGLLWRTDERRCAVQFGLLLQQCVTRSTKRRRLAILLVDNAQSHRVGKTGLIRLFLRANAGRVVLVFLPAYSPDLQPAERLWRQWRPNVTHNHRCSEMEQLVGNSDAWLTCAATQPQSVLQMLGITENARSMLMAA